jgi:hypothetical protein
MASRHEPADLGLRRIADEGQQIGLNAGVIQQRVALCSRAITCHASTGLVLASSKKLDAIRS